MIIDLILDRQDGIEYDPQEFYRDTMAYSADFDGIGDKITAAMDYGENDDVQKALCDYIISNDYNPKICDFINSVNWI